jgi:hypothetical protein
LHKVIKRKDLGIDRRNDLDGEIVRRHYTDLEAGKSAGAFELNGGVAISVLPWLRPAGIVNRSFPIATADVAVGGFRAFVMTPATLNARRLGRWVITDQCQFAVIEISDPAQARIDG